MKHWWLASIVVLMFAGCAKPHPEPAPTPPATPEPLPSAQLPKPQVEKQHDPTPGEEAAAKDSARHAAELLQDGKVAETRSEIKLSLKLDPHNVLASTLLRQLDEDPTAILGKDFFQYKVVSGDTLSRIADRFLGDKYMFYALARYNNITTPRQLQAGQTIKILGKPPKEVRKPEPDNSKKSIPPPQPAPPLDETAIAKLYEGSLQRCKAAEPLRAADKVNGSLEQLDKGHQLYREGLKLGGVSPELLARRDAARRCLADGYYRDGMKALYNQEVDLAIAVLARVLEVDPENKLARDNYDKAVYLKRRLAEK